MKTGDEGQQRMRYKIEAACACHIGHVRHNNEDNIYFNKRILEEKNRGLSGVAQLSVQLEKELCFAVFDGMGGEEKGETAAFLAARTLQNEMESFQEYFRNAGQFLLDTCLKMNGVICEEAQREYAVRMGSTAAMLLLQEGNAYVCNIGDSVVYLLRDSVFHRLSENHVEKVPPNPALLQSKKPRLSQHLGIEPEEMTIMPYLAKGVMQDVDYFLLSSDGLTDALEEETLRAVMMSEQEPKNCAESLLALALQKGGKDNITLILCRVYADEIESTLEER